MTNALTVADRFFKAIETGDVAAVEGIYATDARIWHNNDGIEQSAADNLKVLGWIVKNLPNRRYEVSRRVETPTGFAQEHVMSADLPDGSRFRLPAAIFADVKDGRITVLREYLDSASTAPLASLLSKAS